MNKELEIKIKTYLAVADLCKKIQTDICGSYDCHECPLYVSSRCSTSRCSKAIQFFNWIDAYKSRIREQK